MSEYLIHYGKVLFEMPTKAGSGWKLVAECGNMIKGEHSPKLGDITMNLAEVTCPECQEINALTALVEFT